jgi:hypothetical protein
VGLRFGGSFSTHVGVSANASLMEIERSVADIEATLREFENVPQARVSSVALVELAGCGH